jgi:pimeloyl-ACP methyl ester carboxylesterase
VQVATIEINGADIYYDTYGKPHPGRAPILLIHGSTITGQADWGEIAPRLAEEHQVYVPDCRGHGKSSNPTHSYSFREMADDAAAFIRKMGFERAHVIGHSNGGNVALVVLVEHPEVTQTAVVQAANAYVSKFLIEREPAVFDPERVKRESPGWMNEMIALHGPTHGQEYWRELLQLTVKEILSEPNYTPADLAKVTRPALITMGAKDTVNATDRHAQFIAENVPGAELWVPEGIGHSIHKEMADEWVRRVLDFIQRRGNE